MESEKQPTQERQGHELQTRSPQQHVEVDRENTTSVKDGAAAPSSSGMAFGRMDAQDVFKNYINHGMVTAIMTDFVSVT